jgi:thymidylate synthase ThyX
MTPYDRETFSPAERDVLRRYFTELDGPVFALVNLPDVVRGALFARYSRSPKSLRRLFLDEFVEELDVSGDATVDATVGLRRAEELYRRIFLEFGDDSVAQLGGVHLACEQASNVLTKVLEWSRLMAYLEQSTRYIPYDVRMPSGRYRYFRPPQVLESQLGARYVGEMDRQFDTYAELLPKLQAHVQAENPNDGTVSDFAYRQSVRARALDAVRGLLPAATLSNVGIYGSGQSYELLCLKMRAHPLREVRDYGEMVLTELRKVIPSFLARLDRPERGGEWVNYFAEREDEMEALVERIFGSRRSGEAIGEHEEVRLVDFDPEGEDKVIAAMCFSLSDRRESELLSAVRKMSSEERQEIVAAYIGDRRNRRHKPGRALERTDYRFEIVSDYGAFRDLQRHRMLTIEWQPLSVDLGYEVPDVVKAAGLESPYRECLERSRELHDALEESFPKEAIYAVALAFRLRYVMQFNAREAMHLIELRSSTQGHPVYRRIARAMHRQIAETAGHRAIAAAMSFLDENDVELGRMGAEQRADERRNAPPAHPPGAAAERRARDNG